MAERLFEGTQVLNCTAPVTRADVFNPPMPYLSNWNKTLRVEGRTKTEALGRLEKKVDQYMEERSGEIPLFYALIYGCSLGTPKVRQKLTIWDSLNRFIMKLGG